MGAVDAEGVSVPLCALRYKPVENHPDPEAGSPLIVSRVLAEALPERGDLVFAEGFVRDEQGRIIAARCLRGLDAGAQMPKGGASP